MRRLTSGGHAMRKSIFLPIIALALCACQSVQTTNPGALGVTREQRFLVSDQQMQSAAVEAYGAQLQAAREKNVLNKDTQLVNRVRNIANNLARSTSVFRSDAPNWNWEVNLLATDELNAYVMPGGKIMVYEGIVKRLQLTDNEIAAIMGHEIAHALREHSRERVSRQYAQQLAISGAAALTGVEANVADLANTLATVTLQLPFSREQEAEADIVGLELMARSGYDPNAAVSLWQKMLAQEKQQSPEFLSTHPAPATRIEGLRALIPKVMTLYKAKK
jgi:predicted Zn-dependent protease